MTDFESDQLLAFYDLQSVVFRTFPYERVDSGFFPALEVFDSLLLKLVGLQALFSYEN